MVLPLQIEMFLLIINYNTCINVPLSACCWNLT
nr:MAG TPA: hypothetical protein [Bacteriophage sp.]